MNAGGALRGVQSSTTGLHTSNFVSTAFLHIRSGPVPQEKGAASSGKLRSAVHCGKGKKSQNAPQGQSFAEATGGTEAENVSQRIDAQNRELLKIQKKQPNYDKGEIPKK